MVHLLQKTVTHQGYVLETARQTIKIQQQP